MLCVVLYIVYGVVSCFVLVLLPSHFQPNKNLHRNKGVTVSNSRRQWRGHNYNTWCIQMQMMKCKITSKIILKIPYKAIMSHFQKYTSSNFRGHSWASMCAAFFLFERFPSYVALWLVVGAIFRWDQLNSQFVVTRFPFCIWVGSHYSDFRLAEWAII